MGILDLPPEEFEYVDYRGQLNQSLANLGGKLLLKAKQLSKKGGKKKPPKVPPKPEHLRVGYKPPVPPKPPRLRVKPQVPPKPANLRVSKKLPSGSVPALKTAPLPARGKPIQKIGVSKKTAPPVPKKPANLGKKTAPPVPKKPANLGKKAPPAVPAKRKKPEISSKSPAFNSPANQLTRVKNEAMLEALQREAAKTYKPMPRKKRK